MPGYRSLASHLSGTAAEHAREAEIRQRDGDPESAARLLEEALAASARVKPELPGWVCGRLASIYRTLKRYDDEVRLLERYRDSQTSEEARTRFDARLSKARAIADRKRRSDTGALVTVREVRDRSTQRRRTPPFGTQAITIGGDATKADDATLPAALLCEVRAAMADDSPDFTIRLRDAIGFLAAEGRAAAVPMEVLVQSLKSGWSEAPRPAAMNEQQWHQRYASALVDLLAEYFGESVQPE